MFGTRLIGCGEFILGSTAQVVSVDATIVEHSRLIRGNVSVCWTAWLLPYLSVQESVVCKKKNSCMFGQYVQYMHHSVILLSSHGLQLVILGSF